MPEMDADMQALIGTLKAAPGGMIHFPQMGAWWHWDAETETLTVTKESIHATRQEEPAT